MVNRGTYTDYIPSGSGYTEGCRVYNNNNQLCGSGAEVTLAFNVEEYDTDNIHDNAINNSRLTCKTPGKYLLFGSAAWESNPNGQRFIVIKINTISIW